MLVKNLVLCYYMVFVSSMRTRAMRSGQSSMVRVKKLCGPHPQPGEDCEPSLCSILSGPGHNPELQFLTTCVPIKVPSHQLRSQNVDNMNIINSQLRLALRARMTSSTSAPYDTGDKVTTPDPTPVVKCHGLALCKNLFRLNKV